MILKLVLGLVLFPPLLLLSGILWWGAATEADPRTRATLGAVAAFLTLLGLLVTRILFHSPAKWLRHLGAFPTQSEEFVLCSLSYFRSRARTLYLCFLGVTFLSLVHLIPLRDDLSWHSLLLPVAVGIFLPLGGAWAGLRGERAVLRTIRNAAGLAFSERIEAVYRIAESRRTDEVATAIRERIEADLGIPNECGSFS